MNKTEELKKGCGTLFGDCFYSDMNPRKCGILEKGEIRYCQECRQSNKRAIEGYKKGRQDALKEVETLLNKAKETSGFVGIGEWRDDYDLDLMHNCLDEMKKELKQGDGE